MTIFGAEAVYGLCLVASAVCALLLIRSWRATRQRLLLWSAACFTLLAVNNMLVVMDMIVFASADFTWARQISALGAVAVLIWGFVWEVDQ